jgi:hypothetical protein
MAFEYTRCTKFQRSDCDTDHYLLVAKFTESFAVNKQAALSFEGKD